jgi:hypothetical protein
MSALRHHRSSFLTVLGFAGLVMLYLVMLYLVTLYLVVLCFSTSSQVAN